MGSYPMLQEGLNVIKAWGFTYKTIAFQWVKTYPKCGKFVFGIGNWHAVILNAACWQLKENQNEQTTVLAS